MDSDHSITIRDCRFDRNNQYGGENQMNALSRKSSCRPMGRPTSPNYRDQLSNVEGTEQPTIYPTRTTSFDIDERLTFQGGPRVFNQPITPTGCISDENRRPEDRGGIVPPRQAFIGDRPLVRQVRSCPSVDKEEYDNKAECFANQDGPNLSESDRWSVCAGINPGRRPLANRQEPLELPNSPSLENIPHTIGHATDDSEGEKSCDTIRNQIENLEKAYYQKATLCQSRCMEFQSNARLDSGTVTKQQAKEEDTEKTVRKAINVFESSPETMREPRLAATPGLPRLPDRNSAPLTHRGVQRRNVESPASHYLQRNEVRTGVRREERKEERQDEGPRPSGEPISRRSLAYNRISGSSKIRPGAPTDANVAKTVILGKPLKNFYNRPARIRSGVEVNAKGSNSPSANVSPRSSTAPDIINNQSMKPLAAAESEGNPLEDSFPTSKQVAESEPPLRIVEMEPQYDQPTTSKGISDVKKNGPAIKGKAPKKDTCPCGTIDTERTMWNAGSGGQVVRHCGAKECAASRKNSKANGEAIVRNNCPCTGQKSESQAAPAAKKRNSNALPARTQIPCCYRVTKEKSEMAAKERNGNNNKPAGNAQCGPCCGASQECPGKAVRNQIAAKNGATVADAERCGNGKMGRFSRDDANATKTAERQRRSGTESPYVRRSSMARNGNGGKKNSCNADDCIGKVLSYTSLSSDNFEEDNGPPSLLPPPSPPPRQPRPKKPKLTYNPPCTYDKGKEAVANVNGNGKRDDYSQKASNKEARNSTVTACDCSCYESEEEQEQPRYSGWRQQSGRQGEQARSEARDSRNDPRDSRNEPRDSRNEARDSRNDPRDSRRLSFNGRDEMCSCDPNDECDMDEDEYPEGSNSFVVNKGSKLTIKEIIVCALRCEIMGFVMESLSLYEECILRLRKKLSTEEIPDAKLREIQQYLRNYESHAQRLRRKIQRRLFESKLVEQIDIRDNSTGNAYDTLFGRYLDDKVTEAHIYEPYMTEDSHFRNLVCFLELLVERCPNLNYVRLMTQKDVSSRSEQKEILGDICKEMEDVNVAFNFRYDETLLDHKIILSNGVIIDMTRGLHYFKPTQGEFRLGMCDYGYRRCCKAKIEIWLTTPFAEGSSQDGGKQPCSCGSQSMTEDRDYYAE